MLDRLKEIFSQTIEKCDCALLKFNGEPDHVHLLLSVNPKVQLSSFVNNLKTLSSRLIRRDFVKELNKTYPNPVEQNLLYFDLWWNPFGNYQPVH